jgi:hypothetical protein
MPGNLSESENREKESNEQNMFRMGFRMGRFFHCVALVGSFVLRHSTRNPATEFPFFCVAGDRLRTVISSSCGGEQG